MLVSSPAKLNRYLAIKGKRSDGYHEVELISTTLDHVSQLSDDIELVKSIWNIYCGKDHNLLKPYIVKSSSFKYLNN